MWLGCTYEVEENQKTVVSEAKRWVYFKNDRKAGYMEGNLEVEKGDWNVLTGSGHMELAGDHCKRRWSEATGMEARWKWSELLNGKWNSGESVCWHLWRSFVEKGSKENGRLWREYVQERKTLFCFKISDTFRAEFIELKFVNHAWS